MLFLFSTTLFVSSFLLFSVQPMVGKMLLPYLGGTPVVWNSCLFFFQLMLLGGYLYADGTTSRSNQRLLVVLHGVLLLLPLFVLPISLSDASIALLAQGEAPIPWLLKVLFLGAGIPFFVMATTNPLLQCWFSRTRHARAENPYFLNIASNAGSLLGLISYPFFIEPHFFLVQQRQIWAWGYTFFMFLICACAIAAWRDQAFTTSPVSNNDRRFRGMKFSWIMLSLLPSSLMLGVTTYLTSEVGGFPLLWVFPLALYLLSFIGAFSKKGNALTGFTSRWLGFFILCLLLTLVLDASKPSWVIIPLHLLTFFLSALLCHGLLAKAQPKAEELTGYYLCMALGGVLGGAFNALVSPLLFKSIFEYPLALLAISFFRTPFESPTKKWGRLEKYWPAVLIVLFGCGTLIVRKWPLGSERLNGLLVFGLPALVCYRRVSRPKEFTVALSLLFSMGLLFYTDPLGESLYSSRNYFGVLRVTRSGELNQLVHGNTVHGRQRLGNDRLEPIAYYRKKGPVGELLNGIGRENSQSIAAIGLGVGALWCHARPQDDWDYYEIDPAVEEIALHSKFFTYLRECSSKRPRIIMGDARLKFREATYARYSAIVVDAFSSDTIPQHLLTREALTLYLEKLAPRGVLIFHISNRHLDLKPILGKLAQDLGLVALSKEDVLTDLETEAGNLPSTWAVMSREPHDLKFLSEATWIPLKSHQKNSWTDDYSSLLDAFRF